MSGRIIALRNKSPALAIVAERTGLEPATPGVTGRYSNQLNYRSDVTIRASPMIPAPASAGGCCGARTCDLRLVRATLSQLS